MAFILIKGVSKDREKAPPITLLSLKMSLTFVQNEVIDTAYGQKNTSVYYEVFGDGSGDMWSKMWIDAENGLPYRITMNEPATLNGYVNDFRGNVTYELVSTTIGH